MQYIDTASSDESSSHQKLATIAGFMISVSLAEGPILRIFTRKMCLTIESRPGWNHTFRYPAALLEELKFWYSNIHSFNGYSLRLPPVMSTVIFSFGPCFLGSHPCTSELRKGGYLKMAMLEQWDTQLTA